MKIFRSLGVKDHNRNALSDGFVQHSPISVSVQKVDRDAIRLGGDGALQDLILHHYVRGLRGAIVDGDLATGEIGQHFGCFGGAIVHFIEPRVNNLRHNDKLVVLLGIRAQC